MPKRVTDRKPLDTVKTHVSVENHNRAFRIDTALLKRLAAKVLQWENISRRIPLAELHIALVNDTAITQVNEDYLNHTGATDVISFLYPPLALTKHLKRHPAERGADCAVAELIISTDRARQQALEWQHPVSHELALYVVHGILHIGGYSDSKSRQRARMRKRESEIMTKLWHECDLSHLMRRNRSPAKKP